MDHRDGPLERPELCHDGAHLVHNLCSYDLTLIASQFDVVLSRVVGQCTRYRLQLLAERVSL